MLKPMLMSTLKVTLKPMSKSEQMEKLKLVLEQVVVHFTLTTLLPKDQPLFNDQEESLIQLRVQFILIPTNLTLVTMVVNGIMHSTNAIAPHLTGVRHI